MTRIIIGCIHLGPWAYQQWEDNGEKGKAMHAHIIVQPSPSLRFLSFHSSQSKGKKMNFTYDGGQ